MHGSIVAWVSLRAFLGEPPPVVWRASATSPRLPSGTEKRVFQPKLPPRTLCLCRSQSLLQGCRSISLARLRLALPRTLLTSFLFVQRINSTHRSGSCFTSFVHRLPRGREVFLLLASAGRRASTIPPKKDPASCGMVCAANNRSPTLGCRACSDIPGAGAQLGSRRSRDARVKLRARLGGVQGAGRV